MNKELVEYYGISAQLNMVMEETGELITACMNKVQELNDWTKNIRHVDWSDLVEELAHVKNTIISVCHLLDLNSDSLGGSDNTECASADYEDAVIANLCDLTSVSGRLIKACNKFLRATGRGYVTPTSKKDATEILINAMGAEKDAMRQLMNIVNRFTPLTEEMLDDEIKASDAISCERLRSCIGRCGKGENA